MSVDTNDDLLIGHRCETCKWWSRHESHGASNFRPCRFPLPDSARDYIREAERKLYIPHSTEMPVLMKLNDAGKSCPQWEMFHER